MKLYVDCIHRKSDEEETDHVVSMYVKSFEDINNVINDYTEFHSLRQFKPFKSGGSTIILHAISKNYDRVIELTFFNVSESFQDILEEVLHDYENKLPGADRILKMTDNGISYESAAEHVWGV